MLRNEIFRAETNIKLMIQVEEYILAYNKEHRRGLSPGTEMVVKNIMPLRFKHYEDRISQHHDETVLQESEVVDAMVLFKIQKDK